MNFKIVLHPEEEGGLGRGAGPAWVLLAGGHPGHKILKPRTQKNIMNVAGLTVEDL